MLVLGAHAGGLIFSSDPTVADPGSVASSYTAREPCGATIFQRYTNGAVRARPNASAAEASQADLQRDARRRGITAPVLAVRDGALRFWAALREALATR